MIIRKVKPSDVDEMYDKFKDVSVTKQDLKGNSVPKTGFYEYSLSFNAFKKRAEFPLSLICINKGRVISYIISYTVDEANKILKESADPVLERIKGLERSVVYHDQLFVERKLPAYYFAARVLQTADKLAQDIGSPGVVGASPEKPWKNMISTKLVYYQGFSRRDTIQGPNFQMGLYVKPFWPINTFFEEFGENLVMPN